MQLIGQINQIIFLRVVLTITKLLMMLYPKDKKTITYYPGFYKNDELSKYYYRET